MTLNFTGKENAMITIYVKTVIHNPGTGREKV